MKRIQHTPIFKRNPLSWLSVVFFIPFIFVAQVVKTPILEKSLPISTNNTLAIEALNTEFVFYPSNTSELQINAFVEGDPSDESQEWDLKLKEEENYISLLSSIRPKQKVTSQFVISGDVSNVQLASILKQYLTPILQDLKNNPIPDVLQSDLKQLNFDFEAYSKIGEPYLKVWEQAYVNHLDESDSKEVRQWSQQMIPNLIHVSKQAEPSKLRALNAKNETSGVQMFFSQSVTTDATALTSSKYIIEVGVPEGMNIQLNARHGSLLSKSQLNNLKGNLKYTPFKAKEVGGDTELTIQFAPIKIESWKQGNLNVAYSKDFKIESIDRIQLKLTNSKLFVNEIRNKAVFNGAFSKINILKASNDFKKMVFLLTQSDLIFDLPVTPYNFAYTGNLSRVNYPPKKLQVTSIGDFQSLMLHGFSIDRNNPKELQINAKYSQVFLK